MISKFTFGRPFNTEAAVISVKASDGVLPFGKTVTEGSFTWNYKSGAKDCVFGLGETMRGINKRGFEFISWNTDQPVQDENVRSLYGSHNFIIIYGKETFGAFFDFPGKVTFDLAFTKKDLISVKAEGKDIDVYFITPEDRKNALADIVSQFRKLTGRSYIPPRWGFGFSMSRWGYKCREDIEKVWKKYRELGIPLDSICMDIDYMTLYEDFTVDGKKFPDFASFNRELKADGVRLVPIIDAGVKKCTDYDIYNEMIRCRYECKKKDGSSFIAGVWPGDSVFPDYLNPEARRWFGLKYKLITDYGVEGFWNDMNEPATFYSTDGLKETFDKIESYKGKELDVNTFFEFTALGRDIANNPKDYARFYHKVPAQTAGNLADTEPDGDGNVLVRHDKVHNLFGCNMTRGAHEGFSENNPGKRMLIYSRSSYVGSHRYGGIWTGDNHSYWGDILLSLHQLASLNMTGFMYTGSDIGGFNADTSRDLLLRWLSFGIFSPLCRNHSSNGTRVQEFYEYENPEDFKSILDLRYALLPYLYSEYVKAAVNDGMYFRPLAFDYPEDGRAVRTEDQIMLGDALMLCPVYVQNAEGRMVYLPEDMIKITWKDGKIASQEKMKKGDHYIEVPLEETVFFIKENHVVPFFNPSKDSESINMESYILAGDTGKGFTYGLYEDDGFTTDIKLEGRIRILSEK